MFSCFCRMAHIYRSYQSLYGQSQWFIDPKIQGNFRLRIFWWFSRVFLSSEVLTGAHSQGVTSGQAGVYGSVTHETTWKAGAGAGAQVKSSWSGTCWPKGSLAVPCWPAPSWPPWSPYSLVSNKSFIPEMKIFFSFCQVNLCLSYIISKLLGLKVIPSYIHWLWDDNNSRWKDFETNWTKLAWQQKGINPMTLWYPCLSYCLMPSILVSV